jgi:hypothetical protein
MLLFFLIKARYEYTTLPHLRLTPSKKRCSMSKKPVVDPDEGVVTLDLRSKSQPADSALARPRD